MLLFYKKRQNNQRKSRIWRRRRKDIAGCDCRTGEEISSKTEITYKMIQEYVEKKYGFKVHTAYIAEVKRALGLTMCDAPNAAEELKQPRKHPPKEKAEAIIES